MIKNKSFYRDKRKLSNDIFIIPFPNFFSLLLLLHPQQPLYLFPLPFLFFFLDPPRAVLFYCGSRNGRLLIPGVAFFDIETYAFGLHMPPRLIKSISPFFRMDLLGAIGRITLPSSSLSFPYKSSVSHASHSHFSRMWVGIPGYR